MSGQRNTNSSLRAQRSNPESSSGHRLDCFVAVAPRNDGAASRREGRKWTDAEKRRLAQLAEETGGNWPNIAELMGRGVHSCKAHFYQFIRAREKAPVDVARSPERLRSWRAQRAREAQAARAYAEARALPRSLTAEFFGDPLPGRSALDRMQAERRPAVTLYTGEAR